MATYYAHSVEGWPEEEWERLGVHLNGVGDHAAQLADAFGAGWFGNVLGLLHDIGKIDPDFQSKRLYGLPVRVDHSTAGAVIASEKYGPVVGKALAYCIAGHHAGLANGLRSGITSSLRDRIGKRKAPAIPADLGIELPSQFKQPLPVTRAGFNYQFSMPFMIRMLFSSLVDADFIETENFYAKVEQRKTGKPVTVRGGDIPMSVVLDNYRNRLAEVAAKAKQERLPINELRAQVLAAAIDAAGLPPGMFSMTVPTGGGKTFSSGAFALEHAVKQGMRRVIYVIPYTSIIEQTADVLRKAIKNNDAVLEHHSAFDVAKVAKGWSGAKKLRLDAQNWDRPVVVTTAVQFFESLFANRPSRCRKLHNIANSVIVVDEAQTMPLKFLRPCVEALRELVRGYGCSVVLCTATQPALLAEDGFPNGLRDVVEIAPDPKDLYRRLKRVHVHYIKEPLGDEALSAKLAEAEQVMCIVNSRRHARELYGMIADQPGARHLSTWMCAAHRRDVLAQIRLDLDTGQPVRLVATSLVEAGVDIDFPTVYRAVAGLDSVAQAAGRCNREGKDEAGGNVYVFHPENIPGRQPPHELKRYAEVAVQVLARHTDDPIGLDAIREYFRQTYWRGGNDDLDGAMVGEEPDAVRGILRALEQHAATCDYPFSDVADAFRFIATHDVPIIVPYGDVDDVLKEMDTATVVGGIARKLQQYIVQMPLAKRDKLLAEGKARVIREEEYGDQFVVLTQVDMYRDDVGLNTEAVD